MFIAIVILATIVVVGYFVVRATVTPQVPRTKVAGRLPGPGTYEFNIVGESHYQHALEAICGGRTEESAQHKSEAVLYLEDSNPYDSQAVRVDIEGQTVGYLSRSDARAYRKQLKALGHEHLLCKCDAMVVGGWQRSKTDQGSFGVKLDLPVA
ncbi:MAG TPA: HIRAN domain-containing protein [Rhodanobacteraceae bacterium]|nr:HIRAN domain-containing protein [Rhodanobacteraceae bacterium]